jgi:hypothetical protein
MEAKVVVDLINYSLMSENVFIILSLLIRFLSEELALPHIFTVNPLHYTFQPVVFLFMTVFHIPLISLEYFLLPFVM